MSSLTTCIQHCTEVPAKAIRQEGEIKGIQIGNEDIKRSRIPNDVILYLENPTENHQKSNRANKFSRLAAYKINIQNSEVFLYASNEKSKNEINNFI